MSDLEILLHDIDTISTYQELKQKAYRECTIDGLFEEFFILLTRLRRIKEMLGNGTIS